MRLPGSPTFSRAAAPGFPETAMGNALSIAAVSRVLRQVVEGSVSRYGLDGYVGEDVIVTAEPPTEDLERTRINVFLYRATESGALRNQQLPGHDAAGRRIGRPSLLLDLHYSVTAYADGDYQSELMLGCAMQALNEVPVLDRALILSVLSQDAGANTLLDSRLAEQIENIRVRHRNLPEDVFTRLWSAFHVPYRLTAFYEASVVLVEGDAPLRVSFPVLHRPRPAAHGSLAPVTPTLIRAEPDTAVSGAVVTLHGLALAGDTVELQPMHREPSVVLPPVSIPEADATATTLAFTVPETWPIGRYELRAQIVPEGGGDPRPSNRLAFSVAPSVAITLIGRAANPPQLVSITLTVTPELRPGQSVALALGSRLFPGPAIVDPTDELTFNDLDIPAGPAALRLQVDGIESPWIDRTANPPAVLAAAIVNVP